jgi:hypothetical protein
VLKVVGKPIIVAKSFRKVRGRVFYRISGYP